VRVYSTEIEREAMDFIDDVRTRSRRFEARLEHLDTEEATKTSLVMPFIQMLGYSIFDPTEVVPEYTADFGNKKGEKVDYALMQNGKPVVLIEAKKHGSSLRVEQESQLFRYFSATAARFGILTDGIVYRFYSDLDEPREMDKRPFFEFNMLEFTDLQVEQLKQFHKDSFDPAETVEAARELKYTNEIKRTLSEEMRNPCDDFVRFILNRIEYPGLKTKQLIKQFTPLVQGAFAQFVKDLIDARLKSALDRGNEQAEEPAVEETTTDERPAVEYPLHLLLDSKGIQARARYDDARSFVVLAGSQAVKDEVYSIPKSLADMRKALIDDGFLVDEGTTYRLTQDQSFNTPSGAASFLLVASRNGLTAWKDAEGRTLRDGR
jgi:hypothetical protein